MRNYAVIPTIGTDDLYRSLLGDLMEQHDLDEVLLIDNTPDGSIKPVTLLGSRRELPVELIRWPIKNLHSLWNVGLLWASQKATYGNVAVLNDDIRLRHPYSIAAMEHALRSAPMAAVGAIRYDDRPETGIVVVDDIAAGRLDGTGGIPGWCFMLRIEQHYRFPEECRWFFGDNDMMIWCRIHGYHGAINCPADTTIRVEHVDGGSKSSKLVPPAWMKADQAAFVNRWSQKGVRLAVQDDA